MRKFSELSEQIDTVSNSIEENNNNNIETVTDEPKIPEYLFNDIWVVGYESEDQQITTYRSAEYGTIISGTESILDVGCGRADFGNYLLTRHPNIKYTGVDLNELMIDVATEKYSDKYSESVFNLIPATFSRTFNTVQKYDYVYHLNTLSVDYGIWTDLNQDDNRYMFLKHLIQQSLDLCNTGVVFMLLNDTNDTNLYYTFSLSKVSNILYDMNLKFAIDNTDLPNIYKLLILKNTFY